MLIPKENLKDLEEVPANVREALTIIPAEDAYRAGNGALRKADPQAAGIRKGAYQTMIVKRADFITSMKDYGDFGTKGCPEVAFAGKSNVGKSSMINKLTNRSKLARTSATPGKTRLINVYQINNEIKFH